MRQRFLRSFSRFLQQVFSVVVRAFVTTFVFALCAVVMMHFLGMPVPSALQVWHGLEGLTKLAGALS